MERTIRLNMIENIQKQLGAPGLEKGLYFGEDVLRFDGNMFVVVNKAGKVGVRATNAQLHSLLSAKQCEENWRSHRKIMSEWLILTDEIANDQSTMSKILSMAIEPFSLAEAC